MDHFVGGILCSEKLKEHSGVWWQEMGSHMQTLSSLGLLQCVKYTVFASTSLQL